MGQWTCNQSYWPYVSFKLHGNKTTIIQAKFILQIERDERRGSTSPMGLWLVQLHLCNNSQSWVANCSALCIVPDWFLPAGTLYRLVRTICKKNFCLDYKSVYLATFEVYWETLVYTSSKAPYLLKTASFVAWNVQGIMHTQMVRCALDCILTQPQQELSWKCRWKTEKKYTLWMSQNWPKLCQYSLILGYLHGLELASITLKLAILEWKVGPVLSNTHFFLFSWKNIDRH